MTGGFTVTNNRCSTIVINSNWDKNYLNFVILHEYAHIRLHDGASTPFYRHTGTDINIPKMEREANELAMKLLIGMQDRDEIMLLTKYQITDYLGISEKLSDKIYQNQDKQDLLFESSSSGKKFRLTKSI